MANSYFRFKQFTIQQDICAMKVTTDGCLFGAWAAEQIEKRNSKSGNKGSVACNLLDIGTGTGLLSLMIAQQSPGISIDAVEIDPSAAEQAKENIKASPWKDAINIVHADVKEFEPGKKYDIIISNPPFYEKELKGGNLKKNLAHHNEGLLMPELLTIIKKHLKAAGNFYLLLPYKRYDEIKKMLVQHELAVSQQVLVKQSENHDYFRIFLEGKHSGQMPGEILLAEIAVKNQGDQYSPAFIQLLEDYYLYL